MILFIIFTLILVTVSESVKQYRSDYEYNSKTDAFYKLHTESLKHDHAQLTCEVEGAKLMVPYPRDIVQAHSMLKRFLDVGEYAWVGDDGLEHASGEVQEEVDVETLINGYPSSHDDRKCEAVTRNGEVEKVSCFDKFPFICKVEAKDTPYDPQCKVFSSGYKYLQNVGSCYKISSAAFSWNQAYAECQAEGAHLLVLNSELEQQAVYNLTHFAPTIADNTDTTLYWFVGIRAEKTPDGLPTEYKTIFGQTLQEAGYDGWSAGEPNYLNGKELCGSIFRYDGKYNDLTCTHLVAFICEKEIIDASKYQGLLMNTSSGYDLSKSIILQLTLFALLTLRGYV